MCVFITFKMRIPLTCRILVENTDQFKQQKHEVPWHIESKHSKAMEAKSKVVSKNCNSMMLSIINCAVQQ